MSNVLRAYEDGIMRTYLTMTITHVDMSPYLLGSLVWKHSVHHYSSIAVRITEIDVLSSLEQLRLPSKAYVPLRIT